MNKTYLIYQVKNDGVLYPMGDYSGKTKKQAINNMKDSGDLVGVAYNKLYVALTNKDIKTFPLS